MLVNFYHNNSTQDTINKNIISTGSIDIKLLSDVNFLQPILTIKNLPANSNYAYIPRFERYYFIDNVQKHYNGLVTISMRVDVLETYKNDIINTRANIVESETVLNANNIDYVSDKTENVIKYDFPNKPFTDTSIVLTTVAG